MSTNGGPYRRADETEGLPGTEDRGHNHPQPGNIIHRPSVWTQGSSYASHVAETTSHIGMINKVLLVFVPLGILASTLRWNSILISIFNLVAIIPLSALVSYSSDELSNSVGELWGALINATFGNVVELIVCHP